MEHRISEVGAQMLKYQEQLARDYGYKPIPRTFFCDVRAEFQRHCRNGAMCPVTRFRSKPLMAQSLPTGTTVL